MPIPGLDTDPQRDAERQATAETIVDDLIGMFDKRMVERLLRALIVNGTIDVAALVGGLVFYGGPGVDSGSGSSPLDDTSNGQGGGSGPVMNTGTILGVRVIAEVPPATGALSIALLVNMQSVGSVSLDVGQDDVYILAADAGLSVTGLNRGDRLNLDFTSTDGTVAGIHVVFDLQCDVQRGVG